MDVDFKIDLQGFNEGMAPLAHIDSASFVGNAGQANDMKADIISLPGYLSQPPALANLTNGDENGVVTELIRHILDKPVDASTTYAIGTTKLFKLSNTTVTDGGSPSWPQAVSGMTSGESVIRLGANVYGFYNKSSGGDILKMVLSTESITAAWGSSTDATLENAPHPSAAKEDIILFGNGQYVGAYVEGAATLDVQKLDFGAGSEVVDIVFHANVWWIAVNFGQGKRSQIYIYDASAISNVLSDEAGLGSQQIGWLFVHDGVVYVCYQDNSSSGFAIGFVAGREIKPLRYFSGTLPDHRQKTLYKNTILFISSGEVWSFGASVPQIPYQISKLMDGGYSTVGCIASPFGVPMVSSTQSSNFRLAKFSGYSTDATWDSLLNDISEGRMIGNVHTVIVMTKALGENARCDLTLKGNQGNDSATALEISTEGQRRHVFTNIDLVDAEDVQASLDWSNGDTTNPCQIRKITLLGNFVEN